MGFILGKKLEMTQVFKDDKVIPVTKVLAGPCYVTQIKTKEKDGYEAVQIGFEKIENKKRIKKTMKGKEFKYLKEFKILKGELNSLKVGDEIKVDIFKPGEKVKVVGFAKGKGFTGVVKRYGFHGQPASHGTKDQLRKPGSIASIRGHSGKIPKGKRMAGRVGPRKVTIKNLEIIDVKPEENLLLIKGCVPGPRNGLLKIISC
jgi:large subunit ribosomal protein L3